MSKELELVEGTSSDLMLVALIKRKLVRLVVDVAGGDPLPKQLPGNIKDFVRNQIDLEQDGELLETVNWKYVDKSVKNYYKMFLEGKVKG